MTTKYDDEPVQIPAIMPMLPIRDLAIFPHMVIPLFIGRGPSIQSVEESINQSNGLIFLTSQKESREESPNTDGVYRIGTVSLMMRVRKLIDGRIKILTQGLCKSEILEFTQTQPYFKVKINQIQEFESNVNSKTKALIRNVREQLEKMKHLGKAFTSDILAISESIIDPGRLAYLIASHLGLKINEAQDILEIFDPIERLKKIHTILNREIEILSMQVKIRSQAQDEMTKTQKEYFLREQIRAIKNELGEIDPRGEDI